MVWTEKQIEGWLEEETRTLADPSGQAVTHTAFVLHWLWFDSLVTLGGYSSAELVGYVQDEARVSGIDFGQAFERIVQHLMGRFRAVYGLD